MHAPQLSEKESETIAIFSVLSLPVVQEYGLQNILNACEMQRDDWTALEVQHSVLGLNKIHELLLQYHSRQSYSITPQK